MARTPAPTISLTEFAADWGVTVRTVTGWIQAGMPFRNTKSGRRLVRSEANQWRLAQATESAQAPQEEKKLSELNRKIRAEADLKELELLERQAQLLPVDYVEQQLSTVLDKLRATLLTIPPKFAPDLVGLRTVAEAQARLEPAVYGAMALLAATADDPNLDAAA